VTRPWSFWLLTEARSNQALPRFAEAIAGNELSFYAFEGIKPTDNGRLHITSTRFDEPRCIAILAESEGAVAIHGEGTDEEVVFLGGCDPDGCDRLQRTLMNHGFCVRQHGSPKLQGRDNFNICNRCRTGRGIQFELSSGLRRSFFRSLSSAGRRQPKARLGKFAAAVRGVVLGRVIP
jgi:phage replication-related protein YjqB (UPF0714/DUF867 family)